MNEEKTRFGSKLSSLMNHEQTTLELPIELCAECGDLPEVMIFTYWYNSMLMFKKSYVCLCKECYNDFYKVI